MNNPTSSWIDIGDWVVSKREIYNMSWDVDFEKNILVAAPNGGPIAVTRDRTKAIEITAQTAKPYLFIYSASGKLISSTILKESEWKASVVGMDWVSQERLVIVLSNATVIVYNIFCEEISNNSYSSIRDEVREVKIFNNGVVFLTSVYPTTGGPPNGPQDPRMNNDRMNMSTGGGWRFYYIELFRPVPVQFAEIHELDGNVKPAWDIVEPHMTATSILDVELFVATRGSLFRLNSSDAKNQLLSQNFLKIVVSPCGNKMACLCPSAAQDSIDLYIYRTDCSQHIKYTNVSKRIPHTLKWSGSDGVMMGFYSSLKYFESGCNTIVTEDKESTVPLYLVTEIDGLRIISSRTTDFFCKVPDETVDIFTIGSVTPSSLLYTATEDFLNHSPKADEYIRGIRNELDMAVNTCIIAAGYEFSRSEQNKLLKAASFGKCFLDSYNPDLFVHTCKALRVLNAVRHFEVGIPLTLQQYNYMGAEGLVRCLIERRSHLLAWRICDYLKIKADFVLNHWACTKVRTNEDEEVLSRIIINKLQSAPGISYANIASAAYSVGRHHIATKLLEYEPKAAEQVPPLLTMKQRDMALNKAIESGDTNLVHLVLLNLERNERNTYLDTVFSKKVALDLLLSFSKQKGNLGLLKEVYTIKQQSTELALTFMYEAFRSGDLDQRVKSFGMAVNAFNSSKDKDIHLYAKLTEDQIKLELLQKELETSMPDASFLGLSLADTMYQLVLLGEQKRVSKIKSEFKVTDKRFWWTKIKALSISGQWEELNNFSKEKKSPIGYEPFVEVCLDQNQQVEALKYIPKIQDTVNRCQSYIQVGYFREAAETAFKDKNLDLLNFVAKKCTNNEVVLNLIDQMRAQLSK
ncbi:hypothetical protein PPL_02318 [Heterostelium album PN500]|uniref:Vacuolar protein sorting-associated protein 16 homolog n=1 Tax=Heterostelium pallidum (strain ATCC 26659 / Pp 5 / PN500) TaxID=670386 RepID=D3B1Z3_HETP5|nr:hypothetical protein PPL_02318 [Heterostelium album PN500]EFA85317.1 hypothetical protein PPL_02318 [Heterostelium album PN500]|eukprot:XP_020437426.1 hypothetical protein PPL_02318 [Heterostelium album PN500]